MKTRSPRANSRSADSSCELAATLAAKLVGQPAAIGSIVPYVQMHQAGLAPEGRPVGVFLLLGPTGTGKTRTVEALAETLHGSSKKLLKVDCGEFQMEHEVAKLIGAPPGYLGHRETQPMLNQQKLNSVTSEANDLSIVLFDEIEKAASSMTRLLLGILDKAVLRLGDNTTVNFEKTLIFLTSNLGARSMAKALKPDFGFEAFAPKPAGKPTVKLERIATAAVRRQFTPEFVNRIDATVTYQPLGSDSLAAILDQHLADLQEHLDQRLEARSFRLGVSQRARRWLLKTGASEEYGARELKRTLQRHLIQPLAARVASGEIQPDTVVRADLNEARDRVVLRAGAQDEESLVA
jgi:ATP-dependent Clp protease ATP-binding subunit ClpA